MSRFVEVHAVRLDDYFRDYSKETSLVKMDVEGGAFWAFQGMQQLTERNERMKILTEFAPVSLKEHGVEPEEYLQALVEKGLTFTASADRRGA